MVSDSLACTRPGWKTVPQKHHTNVQTGQGQDVGTRLCSFWDGGVWEGMFLGAWFLLGLLL